MDGFELLKQDHDNVKRLCDELDKANTTERRRQLFAEIEGEVRLHEECEEKVLYPTLRAHPKLKDIVLEGYQEHHVADLIAKELEGVSTTDEQWGAKFKVLKENIEHHIQEEEGPMFRTARGVFTREELQAMGAKMLKMKG